MKKGRIISLLLAALMISGTFCFLLSCNDSKVNVFSIKNAAINDRVYRYWVSYYKAYFSKYYSDVEDSEEGWGRDAGSGQTVADFLIETVNERMKLYVSALYLFGEYKLSLSDDEKNAIEATIDSMIEEYGGKSKLEGVLRSSCNITVNDLREVFTIEKKVAKLNEYLFGDGGATPLTEEKYERFYSDNYSRIKYLYFDRNNTYVLDGEGHLQLTATGSYLSREMSDDEKAAVKEKSEKALERARNGEDFDTLITEYNTPDMDYLDDYPDGFTVSSVSYTSSRDYVLVSKALSIGVGDVAYAEDDNAYYVIVRFPLLEKGYQNDTTGQLSDFENDAREHYFTERLEGCYDMIVTNEEYLKSVSLPAIGKGLPV